MAKLMSKVRSSLSPVLLLHVALAWPLKDDSSPYPHYPVSSREVRVLDGQWDFGFVPDFDTHGITDLRAANVTFNRTQIVPSAWDAASSNGLQYVRGAGFYRTSIDVAVAHSAMLHFAACSMFCRIYIDGVLLHNSTIGGYTPFWVKVPTSEHQTRELVVMTDNRFDKVLTPTQFQRYDFYQFGGIIRSVSLHVLPLTAPAFNRVDVFPLAAADGSPSGEVNVTIVFLDWTVTLGSKVRVSMSWDGGQQVVMEEVVGKDAAIRLARVKVPSGMVWDPHALKPKLHTLTLMSVGNSSSATNLDGITVRFGLRTVSVSGRNILINGSPLKLLGFNRHDMYPELGPSLPISQYVQDLAELKKLGGNFIRGCHYPQDQRFLDLCDESGVLVWHEALAWGNDVKTLMDPLFMAAELATARAMLAASMNNPSVVLWGFFNEGQSDNVAATPSYATMANAFRSRDPTRLVSWASNRKSGDKGLEYADVISFNSYPGWYGGGPETVEKSWLWDANWVAQHYPDKPFIISETGAGGIAGNHSDENARWSEEYQAIVDGLDTGTAVNSSLIAGISLWQFTDIKVDQPKNSTTRPAGINNKGVLTRWRKPKLAASVVAKVYRGHVASEVFV